MKKSKILVISPHPDDETLGAGGTLLKLKKEGNEIFWLNFTDMKDEYGYPAKDIKIRHSEIEKVREMYSFDGFHNLGLKPCSMSQYPRAELVDKTSKIIGRIKPEVVILPFKNDPHSDHRVIFEIAYSCTKIFRAPFIKEILMMEILSETEFSASYNEFVPNYFVDISNYLEKKMSIMRNYKEEIQAHPFPRSLEGMKSLALIRGAAAGCNYAEAFMLLKAIH